jgi:PadR family transcriptional regulator PadR
MIMDITSWKSQLRKGAVELAVLAALEGDSRYGLELLDALGATGALDITEGTIYPLLNRLQRDGKIGSTWVEVEGASHPRKYYHLTDEGRALVEAMKAEWGRFARGIDALVEEGS